MIRTITAINYRDLDRLAELVETLPRTMHHLGRNVFERFEPQLLDELQFTPGPVKYPIEWTSEKQRRAFFATNGFGKGIPTQRSGRLNKGWRLEYITGPARATIAIRNRTSYAPYVLGKLAPRGRDPQQRFHRNTGWPVVSTTVDFWQRAYLDAFETEFGKFFR